MDEQEFVSQQFQEAFEEQQDGCFALYGLGKNTKAVLEKTKGFKFCGLMDSRNTGQKIWGMKVLSEEEVLKLRPKIVIIARESIVPVIYERISYLHNRYGLQIYNFRGEPQGQKKKRYCNQDLAYWNTTEDDLKKAIQEHENISFDIFDTLLMRRVLEPGDVFEIVERMLEARGYKGNKFQEHRMQAEKKLRGCPTLEQIYHEMGRLYHMGKNEWKDWMALEIQVEDQVIVPRKKMIDLFHYALHLGKPVYLISDMYYEEKELRRILKKNGVEGYQGLLVSCEYKKSKADGGLFEVYRKQMENHSCLHIGDNRYSDGIKAIEQGIDTFQIYSAYEMWMASSMQTTLANVESLEKRCILGNLVWKCCEDPFSFHVEKGFFSVDTPEKLGYIFLGPLYHEFVLWLVKVLEQNRVEQLLLPARDGYLIKEMIAQIGEMPFETIYIKASRRAVSVAAIQSTEDIIALAKREFQGSYGELLWKRYGIKPMETDMQKDCEINSQDSDGIKNYVMSYQKEILKNAEKERCAYLSYLESLKLQVEKKQAIFDFVASGTVHYYMQKLLGKKLNGFYFATMNHPKNIFGLEDSIISAYGNICSYGFQSEVAKHYLFLESVMVDGNPTFLCIQNGKFVYELETHNVYSVIKKVQEGILNYQRDMQELQELIPDWKEQKETGDELLGKLFDGSCKVNKAIKRAFVNDDAFDGIMDYYVWGE